MDQVQRFCKRALLLDRGRPVALGDAGEVSRRYLQLNFATPEDRQNVEAIIAGGEGDGSAFIVDTWFQDDTGVRVDALETGRPCSVCMRVRFLRPATDP